MTSRIPLDPPRIATAAAVVGAAALLLAAVSTAVTSASRSDLLATAWRLDTGGRVADATLDGLAPDIDGLLADGACRDDLVRAATVVALAAVDRRNSVTDFDGWAAALGRATATLRHAAGCNPADGMRWALLAAAEWSAAEEPGRLAALLTMSARRSPAELGAIRARAELWARVSGSTRAAARGVFERDVRLLVTGAEPDVVAAAFARNDADLRAVIADAAAVLPPARRRGLAAAGLDFVR